MCLSRLGQGGAFVKSLAYRGRVRKDGGASGRPMKFPQQLLPCLSFINWRWEGGVGGGGSVGGQRNEVRQ